MAGKPRQPEMDRFMSHVSVAESGCWLWTAHKLPSGYGQFRQPTKNELAHRAAYRLFSGSDAGAMDVMHSCDNPSCVNPKHLSTGTRKDNMLDAKNKGRSAMGERHGRSKLTLDEVAEIRASSLTQAVLATKYGVRQPSISKIKRNTRWTNPTNLETHHA